jgi:hypothetical protein
MRPFHRSALLAALVLSSLAADGLANRPIPVARAPARKKIDRSARLDLEMLHQEVMALQVLYYLDVTPAQLKLLAELAPSTAETPGPRKNIKLSARGRKTMTALRDALVANKDEERIAELDTAVDKLLEKEAPDFDEVEISDEARKQAPPLLRRLSARQVAGYIAVYSALVRDPGELLEDALKQSRELRGAKWRELRDNVGDQVGWLVAGLNADAEAQVAARAKALLGKASRLSEKEFARQRKDLDGEARALVEKVTPTEVLRNFMERELAVLLSNPRLGAAIRARQARK